jgi:hypothetical protein
MSSIEKSFETVWAAGPHTLDSSKVRALLIPGRQRTRELLKVKIGTSEMRFRVRFPSLITARARIYVIRQSPGAPSFRAVEFLVEPCLGRVKFPTFCSSAGQNSV